MLYNISIKNDDIPEDLIESLPQEPVVGWALSLPISSRPDKKVEYVLNPVALRELFGDDDDVDEEGVDD